MPPDESSASLSRRPAESDSGPSFAQQGSVDWIALSNGAITFSLGVLQRLSGSSLDAYTVGVGHVLGGQFRLSRSGRLNIDKAIANMKAYAGLQDVLWFGFGMKHPARSISSTGQGATLVALCAALSECFPSTMAAEILNEMVIQESNLPVTPAVSEWRALVRSCAGILAATSFPLRAQKLMGLEGEIDNETKIAEPLPIATVLNAVAKVSRGDWLSITIHGGREARWIAALGEWLFGLTVSITNAKGVLLHTSCPSGKTPQLNIFSKPRIFKWEQPKTKPESGPLELADKTFHIQVVNEVVNRCPPNTAEGHWRMSSPLMSGRVPWDSCLSATFGVLFHNLMKNPSRIAGVLSGAARMYGAIAAAEEGVPVSILERNVLYLDESFGSGLLRTALIWFPELSEIKPFLDQEWGGDSGFGFKNGRRVYAESIRLIKNDCGCHVCEKKSIRANPPKVNCQVVLVDTIIILCRVLSNVECAEGLFPTFSGIRKLYNARAIGEYPITKFSFNCPPGTLKPRQTYDAVRQRPGDTILDDFELHIEQALCLFTGRVFKDLDDNPHLASAISVGGVCIYLHVLREIPDTPPQFRVLHICPGKIAHRDKVFTRLTDNTRYFSPHDPDPCDLPREAVLGIWGSKACTSSAKLTLRETVDQLFLQYDILSADGQYTGMQLHPHSLSAQMLYSYRRISCTHMAPRDTEPSAAFSELKCQIEGRDVWTVNLRANTLGRCAAVELQSHVLGGVRQVIVRDLECLECCTSISEASKMQHECNEILVISKMESGLQPDSDVR